MKTIELFSGTKSFSKVAKKLNHTTLTIDNNPLNEPDICVDIMNFNPTSKHKIDVLWASPPCTCFSVASIGTHWGGGYRAYQPKTESAKQSLLIIEKTLRLISVISPRYWFIENPRGVLRKLPILNNIGIRHTITYCQYGDNRMKPTDIWTNCDLWKPRPACKNGMSCHVSAPRGSRTGTQGIKGARDRGVIPEALFVEIFESIERKT